MKDKTKAGLRKGAEASSKPNKRARAGEFSMTIAGEYRMTFDTWFVDFRDACEDRRLYLPEDAIQPGSTARALDLAEEEGCVWNGSHRAGEEGGLGRVRVPPISSVS